MRKINVYFQAYKVVDQRILNFEHSLVKFQLKQHNLNRQRKNTHNKFNSHEVTIVMILLENNVSNRVIERDILIQSINDNFLRVLYWQLCYTILRYSLIFSYKEQSWMKLLSLLEHENITICLLDESNQTTILIIINRSRSTSRSLTISTKTTMRTAMRSVNETISNVLRRRNSIDIECRSIIFNSLFHRFCSCKRYVSYLLLISRVFEEFEDIIVFWHLNLVFSSSFFL